MKNSQKHIYNLNFIIICILSITTIVLAFLTLRANAEINTLKKENTTLRTTLNALAKNVNTIDNNQINWDKERYNYLAIGNSITIHGICDYWWNNDGMAASVPEKDYFHIVSKSLEEKYGKVTSYPANMGIWEAETHDRAKTLKYIDKYLNQNINLITIQLGENATNLSTFKEDLTYLIKYIKQKAPNADIIIVGDFFDFQNRDDLKEEVAKEQNIKYVSLADIKNKRKYRVHKNTKVYDVNGNVHKIKHAGVANHPGDKAMAIIAQKILQAL